MKKILNLEYGAIHAFYWMSYAVIGSFASAFLLGRGYSNSFIGLIIAVGSVLAIFLQPVLADIADRSKKISIFGLTEMVSALMIILTFVSFVLRKESAALTVVFIMLVAWNTALQPLFNSMAFKLEESGHQIKFGVNRAVGSLAYSALCAVLGTLTERMGVQVLPVTDGIVLILLILTLVMTGKHFKKACYIRQQEEKARGVKTMAFRTEPGHSCPACEIAAGEDLKISEVIDDGREEINFSKFVKRNKLFIVVSLGVVGLFFSNAAFNNFMLQVVENVGGTSEDMGRILSIMAFLEIPPLFLFDRINRRVSCKTLLKIGAVSFFLKIFCATIATNVTMIYIAQLFQPAAFGIFLPAMVSFIDEIMEKGEAVKGQALYTVMTTVGTVFASLSGGVILDVSGASALLTVSSVLTGIGAALIIGIVGKVKSNKTL